MNKKVVFFAAKLLFIVALFVLIFRPETFGFPKDMFDNLSFGSLFEYLGGLDAGTAFFWLGFALVMKLGGIFAGIVRWRILLHGQGVHIPFWYMTKCWFWGRAVGLWLPGTLGLDGYRLVESSRYTGEVIKCTTVIAVEKLTGFLALFTLVFLTVPLGMRLFEFNLVLLAIVLLALAAILAVFLLLLLQPRIVQVLVAVLPTPNAIRHQVNKFGAAVTAYGQNRFALIKALFFGLCVHLGICLMYFGTALTVQAKDVGILEVLFASPLIIVGSVLAPTVSGMGVREVVMVSMLGATAGSEAAFWLGHLGLWIGEFIPFVLSLPLLLFTGQPNRDDLMDEIEAVRKKANIDDDIHLTPEEVADYRNKVFGTLIAGVFAGLMAGVFIGVLESFWLYFDLAGLKEAQMFSWGGFVYSLLFACVGAGVMGGLLFLYLLFNRFAPWRATFAISFAGTLAAGGLIIGLWRYQRDVLGGHSPSTGEALTIVMAVAGIALVAGVVTYLKSVWFTKILGERPVAWVGMGIVSYGLLLGFAYVLSLVLQPSIEKVAFTPKEGVSGPNIILVAIDTLRADYLPTYRPDTAVAKTPAMEAFAADANVFDHGFAQASWTKPSFATMFTGLYPEMHRATSKTAPLTDDVDTVAELLEEAGYYTKGFPNNPNVSSVFNFDQGFVDYTYLEPTRPFGAESSSSKLSMYEVLRKGYERFKAIVLSKVGLGKLQVTDAYQPAEVVTEAGLNWIGSGAVPEGTPMFLYLHYMDPHDPFMLPGTRVGGYSRARMEDPDPEQYTEPFIEAYNGEIEHLDKHLGALFDGLKQRGLYEDALIVLTSDHGEEFCDHGGWWHGKTLYEEQTHVPFIIKLPENQHAGKRNPWIARHVDLMPTMLQYAGVETPAVLPGQSLFTTSGMPTNQSIAYSYAENDFEGNDLRAVRTLQEKVIQALSIGPADQDRLEPVEAYDLKADPGEQDNLAGEAPWQPALESAIEDYQKVIEENAAEPSAEVDRGEVSEQLESLGYL